MSTVKVSALPTKLPWIEGVDYEVIEGEPEPGDFIRVRENSTEIFTVQSAPVAALVPSETEGRDLTWDEFLDVGRAVDAGAFRVILKEIPDVIEYGRKYTYYPGIKFQDSATPGSRLSGLIADAVAAEYITAQTVQAVIAKWIEMYPKMVPAEE